jgi:murein DD-endopeptidase MepM/ murein hydrolase activator NlpD
MPTSTERAARARKAHGRRSRDWRWPLVGSVAALSAVAFGVFVLAASGSGNSRTGDENSVNRQRATVEALPTIDFARRAGGLSEGAVIIAADAIAPPANEAREAGGRRFAVPLSAHAGIEDYFGTSRLYGQVHGGIDFSLKGLTDPPVLAACAGVASKPERSDSLGLHVALDCGDGWQAVVGFLASSSLSGGETVTRGQQIGVGAAGQYLHFEIRYQSSPVDPVDYVDVPRRVPNTPTPVPTETPTRTPVGTRAPTQPAAPGAATTSKSSTPTPRPTGTATPTPTVTNTPTITPTPTWTPTPTRTPPRAQPTPTKPPVSQ